MGGDGRRDRGRAPPPPPPRPTPCPRCLLATAGLPRRLIGRSARGIDQSEARALPARYRPAGAARRGAGVAPGGVPGVSRGVPGGVPAPPSPQLVPCGFPAPPGERCWAAGRACGCSGCCQRCGWREAQGKKCGFRGNNERGSRSALVLCTPSPGITPVGARRQVAAARGGAALLPPVLFAGRLRPRCWNNALRGWKKRVKPSQVICVCPWGKK